MQVITKDFMCWIFYDDPDKVDRIWHFITVLFINPN